MRILSLLGKGILDVLWILVRIAGAVMWLALGALRAFLMLLSLVLRIFFAFLGGASI
ncbi:MAG: hypothetical protein K6E27_07200 [Eubacterium sp.]|nr:hypothetical protein [Eubacterium sp.]